MAEANSQSSLRSAIARYQAKLDDFVEKRLHGVHPFIALAMLILGFACGLPLYMLFQKLSWRLSEAGIDRSTIGFMYWITLAYGIKWAWSPVVDRLRIPGLTQTLGQRRSWILFGAMGTAVGLLIIGFSNPAQALIVTLIGAFILAYSGATMDIAVDAWRIESAPNKAQAGMAAIYTLGYRFSYMMSAVSLIIVDSVEKMGSSAASDPASGWMSHLPQFSWAISYGAMALCMMIVCLLVLFMREPQNVSRVVKESNGKLFDPVTAFWAVVEPFRAIAQNLKSWIFLVMLIVMTYRLADMSMGTMASPFYAEMGYTKSMVGRYQLFSVWLTIAGGFLGGVVVFTLGLMRSMFLGAISTFVTTFAFAWLATQYQNDPEGYKLVVVLVSDNVCGGFIGTIFIAYLSALTDKANAATQYAVLGSLWAFFAKILAGFSGSIVDQFEKFLATNDAWFWFFSLSSSYAVLSGALVLVVLLFGSDKAKGISHEDGR